MATGVIRVITDVKIDKRHQTVRCAKATVWQKTELDHQKVMEAIVRARVRVSVSVVTFQNEA